jgi:cell division septation protein DedD
MANRDSGRSSFLAVLLGLAVLGVFAFVAGGLVGILWKEPGLLFAYLRGDTTEITWNTAAQDIEPALAPVGVEAPPPPVMLAAASEPEVPPRPPAPPVAKPEPSPPPVAKPEPSPPKIAKREAPALPPVAAPPPKSAAPVAPEPRISIQVGAFAERGGAEQLRQSLLSGGYPAYLAAGSATGNARWRVRVGPYPARAEAEQVASRLKRTLELPTWVLDEDAE